jgi:hypothetical protein
MKSLLIAGAAVLLCTQVALGYRIWRRTDVTRSVASDMHLPLKITVVPVRDGTPSAYEVTYEVILTGPFASVRSATVVAGDEKAFQFSFPVVIANPGWDGPQTMKGTFRVGKELLGKCRLELDCPKSGWARASYSDSGQTFSIDLGSYLK